MKEDWKGLLLPMRFICGLCFAGGTQVSLDPAAPPVVRVSECALWHVFRGRVQWTCSCPTQSAHMTPNLPPLRPVTPNSVLPGELKKNWFYDAVCPHSYQCTCIFILVWYRWQVAEPGECSAVCGPGEARRTVMCVRSHLRSDSEVDQSLCSEPKPSEHVPCVVDVCPVGWDTERKVWQNKCSIATSMQEYT